MNAFKGDSKNILKTISGPQPTNQSPQSGEPIIMEGSIAYAEKTHEDIYKGIHHLNPNAKLIYIMRDPVSRVFSLYRFIFQLKGASFGAQSSKGFHNFVVESLDHIKSQETFSGDNFFSSSLYINKIEGAMQLFGKENVKVILFEQYVSQPVQFIERVILPFLEIHPFDSDTRRRLTRSPRSKNKSKLSYPMLTETKVLLQDYFRPYNKKLSEFLGHEKWTWGY